MNRTEGRKNNFNFLKVNKLTSIFFIKYFILIAFQTSFETVFRDLKLIVTIKFFFCLMSAQCKLVINKA